MTVTVDPTARIDVDDLTIGDGTIIRAHAEIYGRKVSIGRDSFIDEYAVIGGGSAEVGEFVAGDWLHMGMFSQVNTARDVTIGDEVGIGISTRIFTHGAYLSEWDGFPVEFAPVTVGSRVWLPQATVLPGVTIGSNVVVAAGSVVTSDLEDGVLAGGVPARVLRKDDAFPPKMVDQQLILNRICDGFGRTWPDGVSHDSTSFYLPLRTIRGPATAASERLRNQLRRHGVRFPYTVVAGRYVRWEGK